MSNVGIIHEVTVIVVTEVEKSKNEEICLLYKGIAVYSSADYIPFVRILCINKCISCLVVSLNLKGLERKRSWSVS